MPVYTHSQIPQPVIEQAPKDGKIRLRKVAEAGKLHIQKWTHSKPLLMGQK